MSDEVTLQVAKNHVRSCNPVTLVREKTGDGIAVVLKIWRLWDSPKTTWKRTGLDRTEVAFITAGNVRRLAGGDGTTQHLQPEIYSAEREHLVLKGIQRHSASISSRKKCPTLSYQQPYIRVQIETF